MNQQKVGEDKTQNTFRRSLTDAVALVKMKSQHWRKEATLSGAVTTANKIYSTIFTSSPTKQLEVENNTEVMIIPKRSLATSALAKMKTFPWRRAVVIGGVLTTASLLTSSAVVAFQHRQRLQTQQQQAAVHELPVPDEVSKVSEVSEAPDIFPIEYIERLDTILNDTGLYLQGNKNDSTSVLLVFDSEDSEVSARNMNFNLITAEVAKARSAGKKVL